MIIEYMVYSGQLTMPASGRVSDGYTWNQGIADWFFPEPKPTPEQLAAIEATQAFKDFAANYETIMERERRKREFESNKLSIAIAQALLDEVNISRAWIMSFKQVVANATSLTDLKTKVAGLIDLPQRTNAQEKALIKAKIDSL